jgi:hypothetical protein
MLWLAWLALYSTVQAGPLLRLANSLYHDFVRDSPSIDNTTVIDNGECLNFCGADKRICCPEGAGCLTDSTGKAQCGAVHLEPRQAQQGYSTVYTSIWTTTNYVVMTSVYNTFIVTGQSACSAAGYAGAGIGCGTNCCGPASYCATSSLGICSAMPYGYTTTNGPVGGGTVAVRPTTIGSVITTMTIPATTTASLSPASSGSVNGTFPTGKKSSSHLSGGAIAGIVFGVLAGILLLFLLCFCCCLRLGYDGIKALFGIGGRRSRRSSRETIIEEEVVRRHRHGEGGTVASGGRRWHGSRSGSGSYDDRYSRRSRPVVREKRGAGWGGRLAALGAGLGSAFVFNRVAKSRKEEKSNYSGSSYDYYGKSTLFTQCICSC